MAVSDNIVVADKSTAQLSARTWGDIELQQPGVVQMPVAPAQVASVARVGQNAVVTLKTGEQVTVGNFFQATAEGVRSDMVFQGEDGVLWQAQYSAEAFNGFSFTELSSVDTLLASAGVVGSATPEWAIAGLGALGAGGAAAAANGGLTGGGGGGGAAATPPATDTLAPAAPTGLSLSSDGLTLAGLGESGASVRVFSAAGNLLGTVTVGADGRFAVVLNTAQLNGEILAVAQTDAAGNVSPTASFTANDVTPPALPANLAVDATVGVLSGTAEAGATVRVRDANGTGLGSAIAGADGTFSVTLTPAPGAGVTLSVNATDAAGNTSADATVGLPALPDGPDVTAPAAATDVAISGDGTVLSGRGEAGATVTLYDAAGNVLITGTVAADGAFELPVVPGVISGQVLQLTLTDAAGNVSPNLPVQAPDLSQPPAPTDLVISSDGLTLTGVARGGVRLLVRNSLGRVIATARAGLDGTFTAALDTAYTNGEAFDVTATAGNGNSSIQALVTAPDSTPPLAVTDLVVSSNGLALSGQGEAGATVTVANATNDVLATGTVASNGTFVLALTPAANVGGLLTVRQADAAGNLSPNASAVVPVSAPVAPTALVVSTDGITVTGTATAGARVDVRAGDGSLLGTATVAADGTFSVVLATAQQNGQLLDVSVVDGSTGISVTALATAPDLTPPGVATDVAINPNGALLSGRGEVGATVTVRDASGALLGTATVNAVGSFAVPLNPVQLNGQGLQVSLSDATGNGSAAAAITAPDLNGPLLPEALTLDVSGTVLSGRGEVAATVSVRAADGTLLGSAVVGADGRFAVNLPAAQLNGQALQVSAVDAAGNASAAVPLTAADLQPPAPVTNVLIDTLGLTVTGNGEPGATVRVLDATATTIGIATVGADGTFSVPLATPQLSAQSLWLLATDTAGNISTALTVTAPDQTPPANLADLSLSANGRLLSGTGEPGATVTAADGAGAVVGTGIVGGNGRFELTLATPQVNGETLQVVQTDAAGNTSQPGAVQAPDILAPAVPTALSFAADGSALSGQGEAFATVRLRSLDGTVLSTTTANADGRFTLALSQPQFNGQALQVDAEDAAGNRSTLLSLTAPDGTAPARVDDLQLSGNGAVLTGTGEVGANVTVRDGAGAVLGTAQVDTTGHFSAPLTPPQLNGQALTVEQADASGNTSATQPVTAADLTAPLAPTGLTVDLTGQVLRGAAEAASSLEIQDASGTVLGTATAAADGTFVFNLPAPLLNGQALQVIATDLAGNRSQPSGTTAPDTTPPATVNTLAISPDGSTLSGTAEAGATVTVSTAANVVLGTATVGPDGVFSLTLVPAAVSTDVLSVVAADALGNTSAPATLNGPSGTEVPTPGNLALTGDGFTVTGTGAPGTTVSVVDNAGSSLGAALVGSDGSFRVLMRAAQLNGQLLHVSATDASGTTSVATTLAAADVTAPEAPSAVASASSGTLVTGRGEVGATVTVRDAANTVLGTALVANNGAFAVTVVPAQLNGQVLTVVQTDGAGNTSQASTLVTPDLQGPVAPTGLAVNTFGTVVSGLGEAGALATVRDAAGTVLASGTVNQSGVFQITLPLAQNTGAALSVELTDASGNTSPTAAVGTPDNTAPTAVTGLSIAADGSAFSGLGEPGAVVRVQTANGTLLGTGTVDANGGFNLSLAPPPINGETLDIIQTDANGNASVATNFLAPDISPPAALSGVVLNADGVTLTGHGEPGATVFVRDVSGTVLGTGLVAATGAFSLALGSPQLNAQALTVNQEDPPGNEGPAVSLIAPDITPPDSPTGLALTPNGLQLSGLAEPGVQITVFDGQGTALGVATAAPNGLFAIALSTPQLNGQTLSAIAVDPAGNLSPVATLVATDITPPSPLTSLAVSADGVTLTGLGEAGSQVTATAADGTVLGTGSVNAEGRFTLALVPAAAGGDSLLVIATDGVGNASAATAVIAPGQLAPTTASNLLLSADGLNVNGTADAGSLVRVYSATGQLLGIALAGSDGTFNAPLTAAQLNGEALSVIATSTDGINAEPAALVAPDVTPPAQVTTFNLARDGVSLIGFGEPGATVRVLAQGGLILGTATVNSDGTFALTLAPPQVAGQTLSLSQTDGAGNESVSTAVLAPDLTAPDAASGLALSGDGLLLSGSGEAGAQVRVVDATGAQVGSGTVRLDGTFQLTLASAQANGQLLSVTLTDAGGNASLPASVLAADTTAPNAVTALNIGADGASITGRGEAGARVTVSDADGVVLGTAVVGSTGAFSLVLGTPLLNAQVLTFTQADAVGNVSAPATLTAVDLTAPDVLANVAINAAGAVVSGNGEAGATVTVRDAAGTLLGSTVVLANGSFSVGLNPPQVNFERLTVQQADPPGNISQPVQIDAPDLTPPGLATGLVLNTLGDLLTGVGEPAARVRVTLADGTLLGEGDVGSTGLFSIALTTPALNGETLQVRLVDAQGNLSPVAAFTAPDTTPPAAVAGLSLDPAGAVLSGTGEAGTALVVTNATGDTLALGTVASDGTFALALVTPQLNGQVLTVTAQDATGNPSGPTRLTAPDLTPPSAPVVTTLSADGLTLAGTGEANAALVVTSANGTVLGTATVNADGTWTAALGSAQLNGQVLTVVQTDASGNASIRLLYQAADVTAAPVSNLVLSADGLVLTGTAEAGASVSVTGPTGLALGTATAGPDGQFTLALNSAQVNGQTLSVTQVDLAGNTSLPTPVTAADITGPALPVVVRLENSGAQLIGTAEAGGRVEVRAADGTLLGSGPVDASGAFSIVLNPPQANGETLSLVAQDARGNASASLAYTVADITAPGAVTALAISNDYTLLGGRGEPGALVTVTRGGQVLGSATVDASGAFVVSLPGTLAASDTLSVIQADAAGNLSAAQTFSVPTVPPPPPPTTLALAADGLTLTGNATAGSQVRAYSSAGAVLGSTTAAPDGSFSLTLNTPQTNGQVLEVTATTSAGGESLSAPLTAADTSPPAALTDVVINGTGTLVTARGEAGATVTVRAADNTVLGSGLVDATGAVSVLLSPAQANGQALTATQADTALNTSPAVSITAPDITPPAAPAALALTSAGQVLTGTGEAGATATVLSSSGAVLGTALVASNGTFSVTLSAAQLNGQALSVTLSDAARNVSAATPLVAADTTPPAPFTNLLLSSSGLQVTGTGEAGATVNVTSATGVVLGTAVVGATGAFVVQLSSAQLNGQVLTVRQADPAGNSTSAALTASDVTPPLAPAALAVAGDGSAVTGSGEAGATAGVYSATGTLLGSATVGSTGLFSVTLNPPQADGQALTVRLTDAAGNASSQVGLTAPDITPPGAPATGVVGAAGTVVTGTGVAGARIFVRNALGVLLGSATVAANGTYSVALTPAQIDSQALSITQADAAGNLSTAITATAPDLTPPAAAAALVVAADGTSVSGTGEAGTTVTLRSAAGVTLGTATVAANGTFTVALSSAQINGEVLSVTLRDSSGNLSAIRTVTAPDVDVDRPVIATDNLTTATVNLAPAVTTRTYSDSFSTPLAGFNKVYAFTVDAGTTADPLLTLATGNAAALYNGATYTLQVQDAAGNWVTLGTANSGALLNVQVIAGQAVLVDIAKLLSGNYRLVVASGGIGVLTNVSSTLQLDVTALNQFVGTAGAVLNGNVVTDVGTNGSTDVTGPDNGAVVQVLRNGAFVSALTGTTVQGTYGTLSIDGQGNYRYTANGSANSVGKVDVFTYQLVHPNGLSSTANLYVRIDSPQATEVWNSGNLAAPATVVDATFDVASTALSLANRVTTNTSALGTVNVLLGGGSGAFAFSVAANTVSDLTVSLTSSSLLSLLGSLTLGLYKLNTANGQYVLVRSWGGSALVSLGGGAYGVVVDDQTQGTYQVRLATGGVGVATSINVGLTNVATYTNQFVVSSYTPVAGNLLTDTAGGGVDVLGSPYTLLSVLAAGNFVVPGYNGTAITGTYGTLLVKADGSYTYTLAPGQTDAVVGRQDVFTYELTHPNGTVDTATLTVNLNPAGAAISAAMLMADTVTAPVDGTTLLVNSSHGDTLHGSSGNDTLDGSHGGALTLLGGAGNDTLIIVDQQFTAVDGGPGTDTLLWAGGAANIDLGNLAARVHNIEVIDLNTTAPVNLTLSLADLVSVVSSDTQTLLIKGTAQDSVHITGHWGAEGAHQAAGIEYIQYTPQEDPSHHLWVQSGIQIV
ncbi:MULTISPECIES: BapA/Bap/LapF family large adhesin [Pseudomonas]|uniref:BapA prefix-like domain-containing protein n=1 Tax=Pseudomonas quercus TaxID=2722792 RepID=A0ABX0YGG9_9PSED|nr:MULTISPECIES: BapA/Bap/LapF family large adhesin [Pseudomonas]MBF7143924.1 BapA prefix-like domain-containing protein [Pseudomonas sp. LY10J]NJP01997.1 BapA prefix-like domain-containing protein [Pseudomonas quercus]